MGIKLNPTKLIGLAVVAVAAIALLEQFVQPGYGGSLVLTMSIFLGMAQGCVALMAAAEVSHAKWHKPILGRMLAAYPLIPIIGLLFAVQLTQLDMYPWINEHGYWLNKTFFIVRNFVVLALMFFVAQRFATLALVGDTRCRFWGVVYLFLFMLQESMVGFEWVMSLEKPWFSTLLGAWFAVGAFLSGICVAALILYSQRHQYDDALRYVQKSIGGLMFGFSVFWAYFYFSQLIVIWYGNLPEEVAYLAKRIGYHTEYWAVARLIFGLCWLIPFTVLMGRKAKMMPGITMAMSLTILLGLTLEVWLMLEPVVHVSVVLWIAEFAIMSFVFASVLRSGDQLLPHGGEVAPSSLAPAGQH